MTFPTAAGKLVPTAEPRKSADLNRSFSMRCRSIDADSTIFSRIHPEHFLVMNRDMNLIRELLLFYESDCTLPYPTADERTVGQHVIWLIEADLIAGQVAEGLSSGAPRSCFPVDGRFIENNGRKCMQFPLTWSGCEFLAAARDDHRWHKAMRVVGGFTFEIIKEYLQTSIKNAVPGLHGFVGHT